MGLSALLMARAWTPMQSTAAIYILQTACRIVASDGTFKWT